MKKKICLNNATQNISRITWLMRQAAITLFMLLALSGKSYCDMSSKQFRLSNLFKNSQLVAKGKITHITKDDNFYRMTFSIDEILFGTSGVKDIEIVSKFRNGFQLEDEPYLEKEKECILFLRNNNSMWSITNQIAGVLDAGATTDLKKVIKDYSDQEKLFEKGNCKKLIALYDKIESDDVKNILLLDIEENITADEADFVKRMLENNNKKMKIFGINQAGRLKLNELHQSINQYFLSSNDSRVKFYCLIALGEYADVNDVSIIQRALADNEQGNRRAAIHALMKLRNEGTIEPLINAYKNELDWGNRAVIISALKPFLDKNIVLAAFYSFRSYESNKYVLNFINDVLNKK